MIKLEIIPNNFQTSNYLKEFKLTVLAELSHQPGTLRAPLLRPNKIISDYKLFIFVETRLRDYKLLNVYKNKSLPRFPLLRSAERTDFDTSIRFDTFDSYFLIDTIDSHFIFSSLLIKYWVKII